jgi:hypothetical protein
MRRAILVLAGVAVVIGVIGLIKARHVDFTAADPPASDPGALLLSASDDSLWGKLLQFSPLGALVTVGLGVVAFVGAWLRMRALVVIAGIGFAACAIQVVAQFGRDSNVLGGRGGNLALYLGLAVGLATLARTPVGEAAAAEHSKGR